MGKLYDFWNVARSQRSGQQRGSTEAANELFSLVINNGDRLLPFKSHLSESCRQRERDRGYHVSIFNSRDASLTAIYYLCRQLFSHCNNRLAIFL